MPVRTTLAASRLEREQAADLRRTVLCGELHLSRDLVDDGLDAAEGVSLVLAWAGGKPVATLRLRPEGSGGLVEHLAVLPAFRRGGLGRGLLEAAAELARESGWASLLCVAPAGADPFFAACGFVQLRQEDGLSAWQKTMD